MTNHWKLSATLLAMGLLVGITGGCANNAELLPTAAVSSLAKAYPTASIDKVEGEKEGGMTVYEVNLSDSGNKTEVTITPDGTILEETREIPTSEVPEVVNTAIFRATDGAKLSKAYREEIRAIVENGKVRALDPPRVAYEAEYKKYYVMGRDVKVAADGTVIRGPGD